MHGWGPSHPWENGSQGRQGRMNRVQWKTLGLGEGGESLPRMLIRLANVRLSNVEFEFIPHHC